MLLHGAPGTGKTLTLMYLISRMPGRTVILVTGVGMGLLRAAIQMARSLAPSMVVLEDVDLIAQDRGNPFQPGGGLLFELLNELDGLGSDIDVIFALTSNRPESLEPALAARPGRIDLAVEFPLPDLDARIRLLELYARGLTLNGVDLVAVAEAIDGASPAVHQGVAAASSRAGRRGWRVPDSGGESHRSRAGRAGGGWRARAEPAWLPAGS